MVKRRFLCSLLCFSPPLLCGFGARGSEYQIRGSECDVRHVRSQDSLDRSEKSLDRSHECWFRNGDSFEPPTALLGAILSKTHQSSLTLKGGSTSHLGLLPSGEKRKPLLLVARNHFILWLADHQRSRQQRSCVFRYATAWTKENEMDAESPKSPQQHALMPMKPIATRPEGAEALSPGQRPGF